MTRMRICLGPDEACPLIVRNADLDPLEPEPKTLSSLYRTKFQNKKGLLQAKEKKRKADNRLIKT